MGRIGQAENARLLFASSLIIQVAEDNLESNL